LPHVKERERARSRAKYQTLREYYLNYQKRADVRAKNNDRRRERRQADPTILARRRVVDAEARRSEPPARRKERLEKKREYNKRQHQRTMAARRARYATDPLYRLRINVAREVRKQLTAGGKGRTSIMQALGYSLEQLREHLERQFLPGMSWKTYGVNGWHIDHIMPVATFDIKAIGDAEFKACWALSNLRPMWAEMNREKRDTRTLLL
jgi:hypothetical protein